MKKISIILLAFLLSTPLLVITFVKFVTPIINDTLPYNFRTVDSPLYSYMMLNKNYNGYLFNYNIYTGLAKYKHSTNIYGLRSSKIDYKKDLVLISGDSIPFGLGLNDIDTFGWSLNKINKEYHFINAGIPGKAVSHNLLTLEYFIKEARAKKTKVKYFINYVNWKDFEDNTTKDYEVVLQKWEKSSLSLKDTIKSKFPTLLFYYSNIMDPANANTKLISFFKSIFIEEIKTIEDKADKDLDLLFSKKRIEDSLKILNICKNNNIKLITVITPYSKNDIFSKYSKSNKLEKKLAGIGYIDLILVKNIFRGDKDLIGKIDRNGDYVHFSKFAMSSVSQSINNFIISKQ